MSININHSHMNHSSFFLALPTFSICWDRVNLWFGKSTYSTEMRITIVHNQMSFTIAHKWVFLGTCDSHCQRFEAMSYLQCSKDKKQMNVPK